MATTKSESAPEMVKGDLEVATRDGFADLLKRANAFLASEEGKDYRLVTIVRLDKAVASVFARTTRPAGPKTTEPWPEDDNEV